MLSTNVGAVDAHEPQRMILISAVVGALIALTMMVLVLGIRTDLSAFRPWMFVAAKYAFAGANIGVSLANLTRIARPGGEQRVSIAFGLLVFGVAFIVAIVNLAFVPVSDWKGLIFGEYWLLCLMCIPLNAIIPFAAMSHPTHRPQWQAAAPRTLGSGEARRDRSIQYRDDRSGRHETPQPAGRRIDGTPGAPNPALNG
jgi:hypothetical protein